MNYLAGYVMLVALLLIVWKAVKHPRQDDDDTEIRP